MTTRLFRFGFTRCPCSVDTAFTRVCDLQVKFALSDGLFCLGVFVQFILACCILEFSVHAYPWN